MSGMFLSKVSSVRESMKFWAFNSIPCNAYLILPIISINFVNIKQELLRYMQQNFATFGLLCFAR